MFNKFLTHVSEVFQKGFQSVQNMSKQCLIYCESVPKVLQSVIKKCFMCVPTMFRMCFQSVHKVVQECANSVFQYTPTNFLSCNCSQKAALSLSIVSWKCPKCLDMCFKTVPHVHRVFLKHVPDVFQKCVKIVPKLLRKCPNPS